MGKTTVSRLVAKLYYQLGVSSKDTVVEVQKGDLVAGYVNQTAMKTAKKIKEARGGILFVDEAYQLTQALQRGQSDFSGEAIDEMMKARRWKSPRSREISTRSRGDIGEISRSAHHSPPGDEQLRTQGGDVRLRGVQEGDG